MTQRSNNLTHLHTAVGGQSLALGLVLVLVLISHEQCGMAP